MTFLKILNINKSLWALSKVSCQEIIYNFKHPIKIHTYRHSSARKRISRDLRSWRESEGVHLAVPVLSVAFDPERVIRLNPAASIPAVSSIWHGGAWLQETLRLCLYFSSSRQQLKAELCSGGRSTARLTLLHASGAHPSSAPAYLHLFWSFKIKWKNSLWDSMCALVSLSI